MKVAAPLDPQPMQSTDTVVHLTLPRNSVGQLLDGLDVLIEQWTATAAYHRYGEVGDEVISASAPTRRKRRGLRRLTGTS